MSQSRILRITLASILTYLVIGLGTAMANDDGKGREYLTIILPGYLAKMVVVDPIGRAITEGLSSVPNGQLSYHDEGPGPLTVASMLDPLPGTYLIYVEALKDNPAPAISVKLEMTSDNRCSSRLHPTAAEDIRSGVLVARFEVRVTEEGCQLLELK